MSGKNVEARTTISRIKWWHLLLGGVGLGVIGLAGYTGHKVGKILIQRKYGALTDELLTKITAYANKHKVPIAVAIAMVDIESGFYDHAYNPNCTGGTREQGQRVAYTPYVICKNNKYWRHNTLTKRARDKSWFRAKWEIAVDRTNPSLWGAFGLTQILPDVAWGYGYSPTLPNIGLFNADTNLDVGLRKMGSGWQKHANLADIRIGYYAGKNFAAMLRDSPKTAARVASKFIDRVAMYEKMFRLPRSARMASSDVAAYTAAKALT